MSGELQAGIGGQASGLAQGAVMSGVSAVWGLHTETRDEERMAELEEKIKAEVPLSREEFDERGVLQGAEYDRLDQADKKGMHRYCQTWFGANLQHER